MLAFLIGAVRSIIEMLGFCLLGQAVLYLLAGQKRATNPIYQTLALITQAPRKLTARFLPPSFSGRATGAICLLVLFVFWVGLAWLRKFN